jgi:translocation and assembly module TamB
MTVDEGVPDPGRSTGRRRAVRVVGWIGKVLGLLLLLVVLLIAGASAYLRTESGLAQLARLIETLASSERSTLTIGSLDGAFPEHLRIENVSLSDERGALVTIDFAELRWRPWRLIFRHLDVATFEVGTMDVHRLPAAEPAPAQEAGPTGLPSLPVDVTLDSFRMGELRLAEAILGQPSRLTASASLSATRRGEFAARADVHTLDGVPTRLSLTAGYDASTERLTVDVEADEPGGGLVAGLLGLPGSPPLRLEAKGDGPLQDWRGHLAATAGRLAAIGADVALSGENPRRVSVDGNADLQGLLPPDLAPPTAGGLAVTAAADVFSERIALDSFNLSTAAGSLRGDGAFRSAEKRIDGKMTLTLGPASVWEPLLPDIGYQTAAADILLSGTLPVPDIQLDVLVEDPTAGTLHAGKAALRAKVTAGKAADEQMPPLDGQAELVVNDIVQPAKGLQPLFEKPARLSLDGRYEPAAKHAIVRQLRLDAGPMQVAGNADVQLAGKPIGTAVLRMDEFDVAALSALAGTSLSGRARLDADLDARASGALRARISAGIDRFASAMPELAALVGPDPTLKATISGDPAAALDLDVAARTAQFTVAANGRMSSNMSIVDSANLDIDAADLSGLQPILGAPIGGALSVNAAAKGPVEKLGGSLRAVASNVVYRDQRIDRLRLTVDARDAPANAQGSLALDAATSLGSVTARGAFGMEGADGLRIDRFVLTWAEALTATTGRLLVPFDGRPIVGNVGMRSDDLAPVGRALGQQLGGRFNLDVSLDGARGRQHVAANLRGNDIRYGPTAAPSAGIGVLRADIDLVDVAAERRLRANLDAETIVAGGGQLTTATVQATGARDAYRVNALAQGDIQGLTQLTADADISPGEMTIVTLRRLQATLKDEPLRLLRPARIAIGATRTQVEGFAVAYGNTQATLAVTKTPQQVDGRLNLRDFDLALIEKFQPGARMAGVVNADVGLAGTPAAPVLTAEARASSISLAGVRPRVRSRTPKLSATLSARVGDGRAEAALSGQGLGETPLRASLAAPVRFAVEPFAFAVAQTGPIQGAVKWNGDIDPLFQMLPIDAFLLSGYANVDLAIGGTVQKPAVDGEIGLTRGSLDVFATGTVLRPLDLTVTARQDEWRLTRLEAGDGGNGRLDGSGTVALADPPRVDGRLEVRDFAALRRDDIVSQLDGGLSASGTIGERLLVSGRIENEQTEIRLVNRLPPSVITVDVVFEDQLHATTKPAAGTRVEQSDTSWIVFDLTITLPGQVFVRGRGLDSEWAGSFTVTGTAADPKVQGSIQPVRGTFEFLGRRFVLDTGRIGIHGLQDITIDLTASYQRPDLRALILVSGTPSQPKITLRSEPELPQDEILARVLFNKSTGRLSIGEAAQLASAAAALASGEPGMLDRLRTVAGLDRLTLGSSEEEGGLGTVEAGKNISENVYVGVEQGAAAAATSTVVEVNITDNLKLRSTTSAEGTNRIGARWEWDY